MMSLRDAWGIVANTGQELKLDVVAGQALVRWYQAASDETAKARVLEAVEVLLMEGDPFQQELAANFVSSVPCPSGLADRLVHLYASRGWDSDHPLSAFVSRRHGLTPEARETLRRVYMQDPPRQVKLVEAVLERDEDGRAWTGYLGHVRAQERPQELASAFRYCPHDRRNEFFDVVCAKGEDVVRHTARNLSGASARELLARCGYGPPFDPRPPAGKSSDAIPVNELLTLLEKQRCSLWFILPAPITYPEDRDRSVFYRRASSWLARAALPWARGREGDRFCDAWYRRDPPELVSMTCWTREQFQERFRTQWRHTGVVPLQYVEPFSRVPRFVLKAALNHATSAR